MKLQAFLTCPPSGEHHLQKEIEAASAQVQKVRNGGIQFIGSLSSMYQLLYTSRIGSRLFLQLAGAAVKDREELYKFIHSFPWEDEIHLNKSFAVDVQGRAQWAPNTNFPALVVKDGIVDRMREVHGERPSVNIKNPDVQIHLVLNDFRAEISIDLSLGPLSNRGYRKEHAHAALRENLAAVLLKEAGWPENFTERDTFLDPMCGSGTIAIEAAMMAYEIPSGYFRENWGFTHWKKHDPVLFDQIKAEFDSKIRNEGPVIVASDKSIPAVSSAKINCKHDLLKDKITIERKALHSQNLPFMGTSGLILCNPPYGKRSRVREEITELYEKIGKFASDLPDRWTMYVFTMEGGLLRALGFSQKADFLNGPLECSLLEYTSSEAKKPVHREHTTEKKAGEKRSEKQSEQKQVLEYVEIEARSPEQLNEAETMLYNRLKKNERQLKKYLKTGVSNYRLYDADLPEYSFALDIYDNSYYYIQEYQAPKEIPLSKAAERLQQGIHAVSAFAGGKSENIFLKQRLKRSRGEQYEKLAEEKDEKIIHENSLKFSINLLDYMDTGIFLDHRETRKLIGGMSEGKRVLNLFCYTATASVYAAAGGALSTVSIDTSNTYLDWARKNFSLNGLEGSQHEFIRSDVEQFLKDCKDEFDLIFIDPPTFSNSKSQNRRWDVQKDHPRILRLCASLLSKQGVIVFSNNFRKFQLDEQLQKEFAIEEITEKTLPPDFKRRKIHRSWLIRKEK
jgi:23S rRNA (guanine2445-N2)-methyltransferase / 23S rRNA (guanine2069-N7)-methyltransferase